jgi:hypothetical protein
MNGGAGVWVESMQAEIEEKREAVAALCRRYGVTRLEVFGSAARGVDFESKKSDRGKPELYSTPGDSERCPIRLWLNCRNETRGLCGRHPEARARNRLIACEPRRMAASGVPRHPSRLARREERALAPG